MLVALFSLLMLMDPGVVEDKRTAEEREGHAKMYMMLDVGMKWHHSQIEKDMDYVLKMNKESGVSLECVVDNPVAEMVAWMLTQFAFLFTAKNVPESSTAMFLLYWSCHSTEDMQIEYIQSELCISALAVLMHHKIAIEATHADYVEDGVWKHRVV